MFIAHRDTNGFTFRYVKASSSKILLWGVRPRIVFLEKWQCVSGFDFRQKVLIRCLNESIIFSQTNNFWSSLLIRKLAGGEGRKRWKVLRECVQLTLIWGLQSLIRTYIMPCGIRFGMYGGLVAQPYALTHGNQARGRYLRMSINQFGYRRKRRIWDTSRLFK